MTHFIMKALTLITLISLSGAANADSGPVGGGPWKPTASVTRAL